MSEKITCPKCNSDQITANKKGFSGKKAVAGAVLTGGVGLLAGTLGSNTVKVTCLACGNEWKPSEYHSKKEEAARNKETAEMNYWKNHFYKLYESGQLEEAEKYYLQNKALSGRIKDFNAGYKHLKSSDSQAMVLLFVLLGIVIFVLYLVLR